MTISPYPLTIPTNLTHAQAYRHLYRAGLKAIHYSVPARHQLRDILRSSFRSTPSSSTATINQPRVHNTIHFLHRAALSNGTEHKILRNILHARFWTKGVGDRDKNIGAMRENDAVGVALRRGRYASLRAAVGLINEGVGLELRV